MIKDSANASDKQANTSNKPSKTVVRRTAYAGKRKAVHTVKPIPKLERSAASRSYARDLVSHIMQHNITDKQGLRKARKMLARSM